MRIRIVETGEMKDLTIKDNNNIEWTYDLLGNNQATMYNNELEIHEMSQENFEWWKEYIINYNNDREQIVNIASELDIDEETIIDIIVDETRTCDLGDEHIIKQFKR